MNHQDYGGNVVRQWTIGKPGKHLFGSGPYEYYMYRAAADEQFSVNHLASCSLYLFQKEPWTIVTVSGVEHSMEVGDRVQSEKKRLDVRCERGIATFLVAGTTTAHPDAEGIVFTRYANLYKVAKPWGHELWINGQHPCYALKQIYIKAGTKTSLQYHNFKQETNVLFEGDARLHFKSETSVANEHVTPAEIGTVDLTAISSIDILPPTLHRLEALTDILLYETSTPHLEDVIRIQDDSQRPHGRIESEHKVTV